MTARLMAAAGPSEIVVSNSLYHGLDPELQAQFEGLAPVEGKNAARLTPGRRLDVWWPAPSAP